MDYETFLNMAKSGTFQKISIEGGQTEGHILFPNAPDRRVKPLKPRANAGNSYARKYKEEDEMEDILLRKNQEQEMIKGIADATSIGTMPNINDFLDDRLTQVYDNYSFNHEIDPQLLVHSYKKEIIEQVEQNPVIIIKGHTGCGKTTQVPQYILDHCRDRNVHCNIVVTQPRRIAAISIAKRVCQERGWSVGSLVGYQVALEREKSEDTRLLYCTAGVLLQTLISKQDLTNYTHIIIDEIHERDNETDFLLIVVKKFLRIPGNRTKVILMSATINTDKFANYFSKRINGLKLEPPVIELESKTNFPVQYFYLDSLVDKIPITMPLLKLTEPRIDKNAYELAALLVEVFHTIDLHEHASHIGSVLIFLPGINEIEIMFETLEKRLANSKLQEKWILCPLHSTVTSDEQAKVFKPAPAGHRKIILATNIAESSITVPDAKYVIDFCLMKMQVQERETSYTSLQLSWISKSQAIQRAGRVGRVSAGRVYRLVSQDLYKKFLDDSSPELLRCPLDTLILKAKELDIGPPAAVLGRAMDPPDLTNIQSNILSLKQLGAMLATCNGLYEEYDGDLTFIGKIMAALPIDPYLSKLIILGYMFSLLEEAIIMACAMAVKSLFSTPFKQQLEAYNSKLRWANYSASDPIAFLTAYKVWRYKVTSGEFKKSGGICEEKWASKYFIQVKSLREVTRLEVEIHARLKKLGVESLVGLDRVCWSEEEVTLILKILLAGAFYPNYFLRNTIDEKDAVKVLGGRDPFTTVYLSNFPINQPGPLYVNAIKQYFYHCGSNVNVSFDGSCKVYLTFDSSYSISDDRETASTRAPGTISLALYRAVKMRHLQIPIAISILPPAEARKRANEIFGDSLSPNISCWNKRKEKPQSKILLPGLTASVLPIIITHINSPGHFFCHINDEAMSQRHIWINNLLNNQPGSVIQLDKKFWKPGMKCVASYTEGGESAYYRASILNVNLQKRTAQVIYVDYGNEREVPLADLKDYSERLNNTGLRNEPPLAIECTLAEIQPSARLNPKGYWSDDSIKVFSNYFKDRRGIALIYSIVGNTMAVTLFKPEKFDAQCDLSPNASFNHAFVGQGYAEMAEEPYLSRENHLMRTLAQKNPESLKYYTPSFVPDDPFAHFQFEPPSEKDCKSKVLLKGPKSPLEMNLYSLTKKCQGRAVNVEWNSVNSVLLDNVPMDPHERLMVAANVTQSSSTDRLTLRNTTLLPNMHGLPSLLTLMFAPKIELRTDVEREELTGALCGLGFHPDTGEGYDPENDIEITFDVKIDLEDLENINKLRFWMNFIIGEGSSGNTNFISTRSISAQRKIKEYLLKLINRKRASRTQTLFDNCFSWDQLPQDILLDPFGPRPTNEASVYSFIWGVELKSGPKQSKLEAIKAQLQLLQIYSEGGDVMKAGIKCELCHVFIEDLNSLRLHLQSNLHKTNLLELEGQSNS